MQVLFSAIDRIERIVVPDVPAHGHRRFRRLYGFVDCGVAFAKTVSEEHFPRGQFGIAQQDPPELNVVAVHGTLAATRRAHEFFQFEKSLPGALYIDAAGFGFGPAKLAEAGHITRIDWRCVMRGPKTVRKRALALGSPHDSVDVIGTGVILDQAGKEIPVVGIIDAQGLGIPPCLLYTSDAADER